MKKCDFWDCGFCYRPESKYSQCIGEEECIYKKINKLEDYLEELFWEFDSQKKSGEERLCFKGACRDLIHKFVELDNLEKVGKVYFLGKDNNMYHWYYNDEIASEPMNQDKSKILEKLRKNTDYIRGGEIYVEKGSVDFTKIYKNNEEIYEDVE